MLRNRPDDLQRLFALALTFTCAHGMRPVASYRALELGGNATSIGMIAASYALLPALVAVALGQQIDQRGARRFLVSGISLLVLSGIGSAAAPTLVWLAVAQSALGLGQICTAISFQTITAHSTTMERDRAFARFAVAASSGHFLGPLVTTTILELPTAVLSGTQVAFLVAGAIAGAGLLLVATDPSNSTPPASTQTTADADVARLSAWTIARRRGMPEALGTSIAVLTAIDLLIAYLPVLGESRGVSPSMVGLILSLRALAGLLSRLTMTAMLRHLGHQRLLVGAMAGAGIALVGLVIPTPVWAWAPLVSIAGFGLGLGTPMTMSWVATAAPGRSRGTALALRMTGNRIGQVIVPASVGVLATALGPGAVFAVASATLVGGTVLVRRSPIGDTN